LEIIRFGLEVQFSLIALRAPLPRHYPASGGHYPYGGKDIERQMIGEGDEVRFKNETA
jgi:hypothetical protein